MFGLKQFRRKQLFNFTITELILLILFILLFFLLFKIVDLNKKNDICEADKDSCQKTLGQFQDRTGVLNPEDVPDDYAICSAIARDMGLSERELYEKIAQLQLQIQKLQEELEKFKDVTGVSNPEDVPESDEELIEMVKKLKNENKTLIETITELEKKIENLEKENESLLAQLDEKGKELEQCIKEVKILKGEGAGLPPCWPEGWKEGEDIGIYEDQVKATYIFTIRLQEEGIWIAEDYHPKEDFENQYKKLPTDDIKFKIPISAEEFNLSMAALLSQSNIANESSSNITQARECRHSVRIFDEIPDKKGAKPLYTKFMKAIESNFYKFKFVDSYQEYLDESRQ